MKNSILSAIIIILVTISLFFCLIQQVSYLRIPIINKKCDIVYNEVGDRNIILRIDDIQANYLTNLQIKMVKDALKRNITLTLGVIPKNYNKDYKLNKFLLKNKCNLEIAIHGYNHKNQEFTNLYYDDADKKIKNGLKDLKRLTPITTFIPPNNNFSEASEKAIYNNGLLISAGYWNSEYGFSVSTYDWENKNLKLSSYVIEECNKDLNNNETCIIMIHPQDYENNYEEYVKLLDGLDSLNASVVNFRDIF